MRRRIERTICWESLLLVLRVGGGLLQLWYRPEKHAAIKSLPKTAWAPRFEDDDTDDVHDKYGKTGREDISAERRLLRRTDGRLEAGGGVLERVRPIDAVPVSAMVRGL